MQRLQQKPTTTIPIVFGGRAQHGGAAHVDALERAGVNSIGLFPAPELDIARLQIGDVLAIARR